MGYVRDPDTGRMVLQTKVTGMITFDCGARFPYDDSDDYLRLMRLCGQTHSHFLVCPLHNESERISMAVTGPPELLWPDPEVRRQVEEDIAWDKGYLGNY